MLLDQLAEPISIVGEGKPSSTPPPTAATPTGSGDRASSLLSVGEQSPLLPQQPNSYASRLPKGWGANVLPRDQEWIGRFVFAKKGTLADPCKLWHHPPEVRGGQMKLPVVGDFF